jgi:hypothetical protein
MRTIDEMLHLALLSPAMSDEAAPEDGSRFGAPLLLIVESLVAQTGSSPLKITG